jgi:hypothetical protein
MPISRTGQWAGLLVAFAAGCDDGSDEGSVSEWLGAEIHLVARGTIDGDEIDIDLRGADAMAAELLCEREYEAPPDASGTAPDETMATQTEAKIFATVEVGGQMRNLSVELKGNDLQSRGSGDVLTVVPRSETRDPGADEIWVEWEWLDADGEETFESSAVSGDVTTGIFSGTPAPAVIPEGEGSIGLHFDAQWSPTERVSLSVTAPCLINDVDLEE